MSEKIVGQKYQKGSVSFTERIVFEKTMHRVLESFKTFKLTPISTIKKLTYILTLKGKLRRVDENCSLLPNYLFLRECKCFCSESEFGLLTIVFVE